MIKNKKIRVGIIGGGFGYYGHYKAFQKINSCEVKAIATKRAINISKKIKIYSDPKKLIKNENLDLISIATIPIIQQNLLKEIIKKDLNLFLEKPLGVDYPKCSNILSRIKKSKVGINFTFPEIDEFRYFKKKFISKKIKDISINWFFDSSFNKSSIWKSEKNLGGGIIFNYFSHALYYIEFLFGKIIKIQNIKKKKFLFHCKIYTESNKKIILKLNSKNKTESKHEINLVNKQSIKLFSSDPMRFDKFNIYKENKKVSVPKLKKRHGKDVRFIYVVILLKRFIKSIKNNSNFKPNYLDGLNNLKWINKIEKI